MISELEAAVSELVPHNLEVPPRSQCEGQLEYYELLATMPIRVGIVYHTASEVSGAMIFAVLSRCEIFLEPRVNPSQCCRIQE